MSALGCTVDQTSHRLICDALRGALSQAVQAGPGVLDRTGSIRHRASAVLYLLLLDHPIDRQGRCRSCRRAGARLTLRRRPCRILIRASYWLLHQPDEAHLLSQLAAELPAAARVAVARPDGGRAVTRCQGAGQRSGDPAMLPPDVEKLLVDVVDDGFALYCCGNRSAPRALVACYEWDHYLDVVSIQNFDRITTARLPRRAAVDPFAPSVVVWAYEGPPVAALRALLNLVHPAHPDAPTTGYPAPPSLHVPRAKQRPMTIRLPSRDRATARATRLAGAAMLAQPSRESCCGAGLLPD